ncbi:MAG: hypothetical protein P4L92_17190 [Rudaea sp.]|nr:hypothetical protein [Rudaea sp.]
MDNLNGTKRESNRIARPKSPSGALATRNPQPARFLAENAWANANRAWMTACRLAATRR